MDSEAWHAAIHEVTKSWTWLSDWTELRTDLDFPGSVSGKEPACQCRSHKRHGFFPWVGKIHWSKAWQPTPVFLLAESPWTEELGRLQFIGFQTDRRDWSNWVHTHARQIYYRLKSCFKIFANSHLWVILELDFSLQKGSHFLGSSYLM